MRPDRPGARRKGEDLWPFSVADHVEPVASHETWATPRIHVMVLLFFNGWKIFARRRCCPQRPIFEHNGTSRTAEMYGPNLRMGGAGKCGGEHYCLAAGQEFTRSFPGLLISGVWLFDPDGEPSDFREFLMVERTRGSVSKTVCSDFKYFLSLTAAQRWHRLKDCKILAASEQGRSQRGARKTNISCPLVNFIIFLFIILHPL